MFVVQSRATNQTRLAMSRVAFVVPCYSLNYSFSYSLIFNFTFFLFWQDIYLGNSKASGVAVYFDIVWEHRGDVEIQKKGFKTDDNASVLNYM